MKKIFLILVVLLAAAPAMAVVTITATQVGTTDEVDLIVTWSGEGSPPRAFAIDVNVGGGQTITGVSGYHTGDSTASGKGYGIFPASFARYINPDFNNWDDVNYTPVADVNDLPGDTEGGIGTSGVTLELGSLYVGAPNAPTSPVTLARIKVSDDCTMCFARNVGRGKVVLEDGNEPSSFSAPCFAVTVVCTVPDVVGDTNLMAQVTIQGAGFGIGDITTECSVSTADGNVISTDPAAFETPGCNTDVNLVVSTGPLASVPDVLDMNGAAAIAAINAVSGLTAGTPTYECNDTIADGNVISTTPVAGATCDPTVDLVVSTGSCVETCDCCGDLTGDGYVRFDDRVALTGLLTTFGVEIDRKTTITPAMDQWNPCADLTGDGYMRFDDRVTLTGLLTTYGVEIDRKTTIECPHAYGSCP